MSLLCNQCKYKKYYEGEIMKKAYWIECDDKMENLVLPLLRTIPSSTIKVTPAKTLSREKVEEILQKEIKDYFGYKDVDYPLHNITFGDLPVFLANKICELVVDNTEVGVCEKHNYAYVVKNGKPIIGCIPCKEAPEPIEPLDLEHKNNTVSINMLADTVNEIITHINEGGK